MKIAIGSDENTTQTEFIVNYLSKAGYKIRLFGSLDSQKEPWSKTAKKVAEDVFTGVSEEAILLCWTGTGVCIAANKVPKIRAALCCDAETARGARLWNDANVLCLSLRKTTKSVAKEILDAWFETSYEPNIEDDKCIEQIQKLEQKYFMF